MADEMEQLNPLDSGLRRKIGIETESFSRKDIIAYQLQKLKEAMDFVTERSPFYRKRLNGHSGKEFACLEDLTKLPFTTPQDIQEHGAQMLCVSQSEIERVVTLETSGTTGVSKRLYFTRDDQELTIEFFRQGMSLLTRPGERVFILFEGQRPGSIGALLHTALTRIGVITIKHGLIKSLPETMEKMTATKAEVLVGSPIQVLALARYDQARGGKDSVFLKRILLTTDYVSAAITQELRKIWGCEVFDYFGMTEMGLGGGIECSQHHGYHLYEGDFIYEIVDPDTGEAVSGDRYGEVVITTLTRRGMPLIRYRTGDLSRFIPEKCSCGSITNRLGKIRFRKSGMVSLANNQYLTMAELDEALLDMPGLVDYKASVYYKTGAVELKVTAFFLGHSGDLRVLRKRLRQIPSLCLGLERGGLELSLEIFLCGETYIPGVGKRKIGLE